MIFFCFFMFSLSWSESSELPVYKFEPEYRLRSLPVDDVLQSVNALVQGEDGKIYLLDAKSNCLYIFNSDGRFFSKVGRTGSGPGEFAFTGDMVNISFNESRVIVLDINGYKAHYFKNGLFEKTRHIIKQFGRPLSYNYAFNNIYIEWQDAKTKTRTMTVHNEIDLSTVRILDTVKDETWVRKNKKWIFNPFSPGYAKCISNQQVIFGSMNTTLLHFYTDLGTKKTISFKLSPREITTSEKEEISQNYRGRFMLNLPQCYQIYTKIIKLSPEEILIVSEKYFSSWVDGIIIDFRGRKIGRLPLRQKTLISCGSKMAEVVYNEAGDLQVYVGMVKPEIK